MRLGNLTAQSERDTRGLRILGVLGSTLVLDDIANRALEHAAEEVGADGAIALLQRGQQEAYSASFGLSQSESERELVGLPPSLNDARAVTIRYRYSAEEVENDAFRLTGGLAVPLEAEGARIGTLAVFWRKDRARPGRRRHCASSRTRAASSRAHSRTRGASRRRATSPTSTRRPASKASGTSPTASFARSRAPAGTTAASLSSCSVSAAGRRGPTPWRPSDASPGAIRTADIPCYLGGGEFAVIAPEAAHSDAERLAERIRFAALARPQGGARWAGLGIAGARRAGQRGLAPRLGPRGRPAGRAGSRSRGAGIWERPVAEPGVKTCANCGGTGPAGRQVLLALRCSARRRRCCRRRVRDPALARLHEVRVHGPRRGGIVLSRSRPFRWRKDGSRPRRSRTSQCTRSSSAPSRRTAGFAQARGTSGTRSRSREGSRPPSRKASAVVVERPPVRPVRPVRAVGACSSLRSGSGRDPTVRP